MPQTLTLDSLLEMGRTGDGDRFVNLATAALANGVNHDPLRWLLVRRLAERGLLHRAASVAESVSEPIRANPEFTALIRTLRSAGPDGRVPWARFAAQFSANVHVLRERYSWAEQVEAAWSAHGERLELHVTKDGTFAVFEPRSGGNGRWRPAFGGHVPQPPAHQLARELNGRLLIPVVIEGVGLGYHLPWLYAATADTFVGSSALIYQIEPSFLALAVALHVHDWVRPLADERVRLCAGPDAYDEFERAVQADSWNVPPRTVIPTVPWEAHWAGTAQRSVEKLAARYETERAELQTATATLYAGRDRAWWHRRYCEALRGAGPPLRVLGLTSRFTSVLQYAMRDALNALRANGCEVRLLIEPSDYSRSSPRQTLRTLREFQPDLVLLIDHTRRGQHVSLVEGVPVVTWIQDRLPWLFDRATGAALGELDFCLGFGFAELVTHYGYPAERFLPCHMATDPAALLPQGATADGARSGDVHERADPHLACEVAYMTHASQRSEQYFREYRERAPEPFRPLLDLMFEELVGRAAAGTLNGDLGRRYFLRKTAGQVGIELAAEQERELEANFLRVLVDLLLRHQTIAWTAAWASATGRRFHLYGKGWEMHPEFGRYARGVVQHGPELGRAFRAAKVNLHAGANPALHQRVLDGLAAGGFFLIRLHAADIAHRVLRAIYESVRANGREPPARIRYSDLPPPLDSECAALLRLRGRDPADPWELGAEEFLALRAMYEIGTMPVAGELWPEFERVTFHSQEQLAERLEWFLAHEEERRAIAASMRERVLERFTYHGLMRRLLDWVLGRLDSAADLAPPIAAHAGA